MERITVADNPWFLRFVQVARDDKQFGGRIRRLLTLPRIYRLQELDSIIAAMSKDHVHKDIISVAKALADNAVAKKVLDIIEKQ